MADVLGAIRRRWRSAYDRLRDSEAPGTLLAVGIALGLVLGLWWGRSWAPEEPGAAAEIDRAVLSEGQQRTPAADGAPEGRAGSPRGLLGQCEEVFTAQVRPLSAVGPAMTQWEVHVGAMNKLVLGSITLAQAQQFWDDTRKGASRRLAEFNGARRVLERGTVSCPRPAGRRNEELRGCAAVVGARDRVLDRAVVSLATWRTHVDHMEMLRRGELTPEAATQMWLESWRKGSHQMHDYRTAARAAQRLSGEHRHDHGGAGGPCAG